MPGAKHHTHKQRLDIVRAVVADIDTQELSIYKIAKKHKISPSTLDKWSADHDDIRALYETACIDRAWKYYDKAQDAIEEIEEFYDNGKGELRERQQSINKAKFRFDSYKRLAADLAPLKFGDKSKELLELLKVMADIRTKLEQS